MNTSAEKPKVPKAVPVPTPVTQPYWDATRGGELRVQKCGGCGNHFFYPRPHCPRCASTALSWVRCSGRATLYSYVINHVAPPGWEGDTPYVIAVVQLEEGPRMLSNLVDVAPDPKLLPLDLPLEVKFQARGNEMLPVFRPTNGGTR